MVQLSLVLAPFRTNITSQGAFGSTNLTLLGRAGAFDDPGPVRRSTDRAFQAATATAPWPRRMQLTRPSPFWGFGATRQMILERPLRKGDVAAICLNYGQVTRDMLNVHATDLWQMESALRANPRLTNSLSPDVYQGATMYLCGMSYYEKMQRIRRR